ncbi:MAG: prepilin peptidase [Nocardioides sp.]|nr:prepilin peptidase [Nocardioides sp.]
MTLILIATAALGLAVGSFLNVVVHRVPLALSVASPASRCPECHHPIRHRHILPVLGWLLLRGRCADCAAPISARYPAVELLTAALFVGVTARLVQLGLPTAIPAFLWFVAVGIVLALIDLDVRRLPDLITLPAYPVLAVLLSLAAVLAGEPESLLRASVGATASYAFYYALALVKPGAMGFGDVKAAGLVGGMLAFVSYPVLLVGTLAAFMLGASVGVAAMVARRAERTTAVPFGPFMVAGALLAVFLGAPLAETYHRLLMSV